MDYQRFAIIALAFFLVPLVGAVECGSTPTSSCTVSGSTTFSPGTYALTEGIYIMNDAVTLDCNGATLRGQGSGIGIDLQGHDGVIVKNCNVDGFSIGLYMTSESFYNSIHHNTFRNNFESITQACHYSVYGNEMYANNIYDPLSFCFTNSNSYCSNGVTNTYFEGVIGPGCDCFRPFNGLRINHGVKFCPGTYSVPQGVRLAENYVTLDCGGATLRGTGDGVGVTTDGYDSTTIKNCNLVNYSAGIYLEHETYYGFVTQNTIRNSGSSIGFACTDRVYGNTLWKNTLGSNISFCYSNENYFCQNQTGNMYLDGVVKQGCDCISPSSGFFINSYAKLCEGTYRLSKGFTFTWPHAYLDCNGATLLGNGGDVGIDTRDSESVTIKNCIISGFGTGIILNRDSHSDNVTGNTIVDNTDGGISIHLDSYYHSITNNVISGNLIGIGLDSRIYNTLLNNQIYGNRDYNIVNSGPQADASGNWWGTTDTSLIDASIYDDDEDAARGRVEFQPFSAVGPQVEVSLADVTASSSTVRVRVVNSGTAHLSTLALNVTVMRNGRVNQTKEIILFGVTPGSSTLFTASVSLVPRDEVHVLLDPTNRVFESNELNNYQKVRYFSGSTVFVDADIRPHDASDVVEEFISENIAVGSVVSDESLATTVVVVSPNNPSLIDNAYTLSTFGWGYGKRGIEFSGKKVTVPYGGFVGSFDRNGKHYVYILGNSIDGFIAATKEFVRGQTEFLNSAKVVLIDTRDIDGISVHDYLKYSENKFYVGIDSSEFLSVVRNALSDKMFFVEDKQVNAGAVPLRLRNLKPAFSGAYLAYKDTVGLPVVLSQGLWSNLYSWQSFGEELATSGRDTWLIEITGGPGQDCPTCPDYTFDDLTDSYVPALLNGVLSFSGKQKLQYVGFSNGCRSALSSLEKRRFDPAKVDTFVGVACPGAFNRSDPYGGGRTFTSPVANIMQWRGEDVIGGLTRDSVSHITLGESLLRGFTPFDNYFSGDYNISKNLLGQYYIFMSFSNDSQPGNGISLKTFGIIEGTQFIDSDGVVLVSDQKQIYDQINSLNKRYLGVFQNHRGIPFDSTTQKLIRRVLYNESLSAIEKQLNQREAVP